MGETRSRSWEVYDARGFWSEIADTFEQDPGRQGYYEEHDVLVDYLVEVGAKKVLEVGVGFGRELRFLREREYDVAGVDISPVMLQKAKRYVPRARLVEADIIDLPFEKDEFDVAFTLATFTHVPPVKVYKGLAELARVGKWFVIIEYAAEDPAKEGLIGAYHCPNTFAYYWPEKLKRLGYAVEHTRFTKPRSDASPYACILGRKEAGP